MKKLFYDQKYENLKSQRLLSSQRQNIISIKTKKVFSFAAKSLCATYFVKIQKKILGHKKYFFYNFFLEFTTRFGIKFKSFILRK